MQTKTIQDVAVPALGYGTWQLTGSDCVEGVADALRIGYRHIDTAQAYGNEAQVGEGMRQAEVTREHIFLVSKIWPENFATDLAEASVHESLRKLDTDYLDLMLLHWPSRDNVPHAEPLTVLAKLREQGKVRQIGVSNFSPEQVEEARQHAPIFCNQVPYHPYQNQSALLDQATKMGYLLTAYSPLARSKVMQDATLASIGEQHGKTPAQVTLRWLIQQQNVCAIPKAATAKHRRSNFDIFDFDLTDEQMQQIAALTQ
ncbi:MAG: aldo/keto reductase [Phycisphaeraceae bacterium]